MTRKWPPRSRSRSTGSDGTGGADRPRPTPSPLDVAARILARAPRTEAELAARLVARGYRETTAERTVARCRELGYVGDERLAFDRARRLRERGAGSLRIAAELEARGLSAAVVAAAVAESLDGEPELAWARRVLARERVTRPAQAWRLLAGRGFPEEVVADLVGDPADDS